MLFQIDLSKLTMQFFGGSIIGAGSIDRIVKATKMLVFAIYHNLGLPFSAYLVPCHTFIAGSIATKSTPIEAVLLVRASAKIVACIIQAIAIDMIYGRGGITQYYAMHPDKPLLLFEIGRKNSTKSVPGISTLARKPFPLRQPLVIGGINNSDLAFSKRDGFNLRKLWGIIRHGNSFLSTVAQARDTREVLPGTSYWLYPHYSTGGLGVQC